MKKSLLLLALISTAISSCGEKSTSTESQEEANTTHEISPSSSLEVVQNTSTSPIIDSYLEIKDALVADDAATASATSEKMVSALEDFDTASMTGNGQNLEEVKAEAIELTKKLQSEDIVIQRENFQALSVVLMDFIKIAGADRTLYHQYCPMYKNNTGGMWLSSNQEIMNPLFGSSMLNCGSIEETITVN
ncbi:DUF3347 domain-containing protein [Algoriphagus sp.]|uniref:DUF3347 domain-containing protein n=1 Tax=Algoriphagus sp. TaxID=1872435 RepID=UPI00261022B1|nr:DUF3347 domain-containing protein [Algoriphagus sp.]